MQNEKETYKKKERIKTIIITLIILFLMWLVGGNLIKQEEGIKAYDSKMEQEYMKQDSINKTK